MGTIIKQTTIEDIYVSVLQARLVVNEEGWKRFEPIDKRLQPTGSLIMDAVAAILSTTDESEASGLAKRLEVSLRDLNGAVRILTGMLTSDLIMRYRMRQVKEWLSCTDLSISEIASKSPFSGAPALSKHFLKTEGMTPGEYRRKHRPENFRELYRW